MYQDYKDLLSAFHAHGVRYLIVGGYAVIFHAQPRFTKDIDLFIQSDPAKARATYAGRIGAALDNIHPKDFTDRHNFFRFGRDPHGFDILPGLPGVDFEAAWEPASDKRTLKSPNLIGVNQRASAAKHPTSLAMKSPYLKMKPTQPASRKTNPIINPENTLKCLTRVNSRSLAANNLIPRTRKTPITTHSQLSHPQNKPLTPTQPPTTPTHHATFMQKVNCWPTIFYGKVRAVSKSKVTGRQNMKDPKSSKDWGI